MKKILNNKELLQQFINDKNILSQKELVQKYDVSQATVSRLLKQFSSQNNSKVSQDQSQYQSEQESEQQSEQQSEQEQNEQSEQEQSEQSIHEQEQSEQSIQVQQSFIEHQNNSLIEYLNEQQLQQQVVEQKKYEQKKNQQPQMYKKVQVYEDVQIVPQPIKQVEIKVEPDEDVQSEKNNQMIKIRKLIQYFNNEQCIFHIIGNSQSQQRQFTENLYNKDLKQLSDIYVKLQFELLFSRQNDFMQNTIETTALFMEKLLLVVNIDVLGCFDEMKQDDDYQFYMKMLLADQSYIPSAKQIILMKFVKNYYQKYQQNKNKRCERNSNEEKERITKKVDQALLDKFNNL